MPPQNVDPPMIDHEGDRATTAGKMLANPPPGEEVVITGMAGRFPDSDDVYEYRDKLFNKRDMMSSDDRRWVQTHPEIPHRTGKIGCVEKFDAGFFGINYRQAQAMDPSARQLLERTYEAILDAGYHPEQLRGTNTGVFIGSCFSESEKTWFYEKLESPTYGMTGCNRSMQAHWISFMLGLEGPSHTIDTACSSSLYALEHAYRAIRSGRCDAAVVGGSNLCLHPTVSLQFARLGVLSADGSCKSFDASANGYARAETTAIVFLQKAKDARRIYAQVIHCKSNCDGFKEQGITFPSYQMQRQLLKEIYEECQVDPSTIDFLEAHATGTKVGDPEEIMAMDEIFCANRKEPLLIGSVKANLGHTEPSSGLCSLIKVILGMENNCLIPNINYSSPREGAEGLEQGRMVVLTEKIPWPENGSGLTAVNSFGFGGANCHVLVKRWTKVKKDGGKPSDNLPRLVCVSGRNENSINYLLDDVKNRPIDAEFTRMLHEIFRDNIPAHDYRGFSIVSESGEHERILATVSGLKQSLCVVFGGPNQELLQTGKKFLMLPLCQPTIQRINQIASAKNVDVLEMINKSAPGNVFADVIIHVSVHAALIDIFKTLEIIPDYVVGYSLGKLGSAYADGLLNLQQIIDAAICLASSFKNHHQDNNKNHVKNGYQDPETIKNIRPELIGNLKNIVSKSQLSPESLADALLSTALPIEVCLNLPPKTILLKVGPAQLDLPRFDTLNLLDFNHPDVGVSFLTGLGRLYTSGYNPKLWKLYPTIQWPVSASTPMISPLIKWNHDEDWFVALFREQEKMQCAEKTVTFYLKDPDWVYMAGHVIDGRNLVPATSYLGLVWETLTIMEGVLMNDSPVIFENIKLHRATTLSRTIFTAFIILVQKTTGLFEVRDSNQEVVTGTVRLFEPDAEKRSAPPSDEVVIEMDTKDIYKELKLRGYHYTGGFRGLKGCNCEATYGLAEWTGRWDVFMDNMLQLKILQEDTRNLYVPTSIAMVIIDPRAHITYARKIGDRPNLPISASKETGIIKSGGIEIWSLFANTIAKRKARGEPILETHKFVPYQGSCSLTETVRVFAQIFLENNYTIKIRAVELPSQAATETSTLIAPLFQQALGDQPLIQSEVLVYSQEPLEIPGIQVENKKLRSEKDSCSFVIVSNLFQQQELKEDVLTALKEGGMIISREDLNFEPILQEDLEVIAVHQTDVEKLVLLHKPIPLSSPTVISITTKDLDWLTRLKSALHNKEKVILLSENATDSGVLGLFSCLRREAVGVNVNCFFIMDQGAPDFNLENEFFQRQWKKGLTMNVFKDGKWGTYKHLVLNMPMTERPHILYNIRVRGDLSTVRWIEGPLTNTTCIPPEKTLIYVYYASLNFRDVMTSTGRIPADVITRNRLQQLCVEGFEFVGRTPSGERVAGMITSGGLSSMVVADSHLLIKLPDELSMADGATIPVAYGTVILGFIKVVKMKKGQSVLIHAGSGAVGQAAINVALYYDCEVFTTVGTEEKIQFIRETFPQIPASHIGNSRDTSFEQMIMKETKGRGVDIVLNSLAEEKLLASVRCLAPGGDFVEIGKFDLANNSLLGLKHIANGRRFHGVMLDYYLATSLSLQRPLIQSIEEGMATGMVKPLRKTIFNTDQIEEALRYMGAGKHIGKVIIKVREEETEKVVLPRLDVFPCHTRFYASPNKTHIICGGLGGFGLELADWLIIRGVKNLLLVSRTGLKNGYQASRIRIWKSYGVDVEISTADITTEEGCAKMLDQALQMGPIEGIFNLAVVLKDGLLENQTEESFRTTLAPKASATQHLDKLTRTLCPDLLYFVVFSSVSCGRGNLGQTNYGMANSVMERICEQRKKNGYPALAIQWGAVGDVGLVADMQELQTEIEIGGTLQQRITSCLEVMDTFLGQDEPVVSSMVVAEKKNAAGVDNMVDAVKSIMGVRDLKTISLHAPLSEMGMDSMMAIEIKQTLEREYEVFLTAQDIRNLTFARLLEISDEKATEHATKSSKGEEKEKLSQGINLLFRFIGDEENANVPMVRLTSLVREKSAGSKIFLLPGIEGMANVMEPLASSLAAHVYCLQYGYKNNTEETIEELAQALLPIVQANQSKASPFTLVGYSFGAVVIMELAALLEAEGRIGRVFLIDGSPSMFQEMAKQQVPNYESEAVLQTLVVSALMQLYMPIETIMQHKLDILNCKSMDERIKIAHNLVSEDTPHSEDYRRRVCYTSYTRIRSALTYTPKFKKLKSMVKLFKPNHPTVEGIAEDFKVQELCENPIEMFTVEGNHLTVVKNPQVAYTINNILETSRGAEYFKKSILKEKGDVETFKEVDAKQI